MHTNQRRFSNRKTAFLFCIIKKVAIAEMPKYHFPQEWSPGKLQFIYTFLLWEKHSPSFVYSTAEQQKPLNDIPKGRSTTFSCRVFSCLRSSLFCALCTILYIIFFIFWLIILFLRCYNVLVTKKTYLTHLFEQQSWRMLSRSDFWRKR